MELIFDFVRKALLTAILYLKHKFIIKQNIFGPQEIIVTLSITVSDQKYFLNVGISIDFHVLKCFQEILWPTHSYAFGFI